MNIQHLPYEVDPAQNRFHFYENHWKAVALELLGRHTTARGKTLLDFGCGRGETLALAKRMGMTATGTDTDPECVRLAAQHGPSVVLNAAAPVAQFGRRSFDVVACFHVLEHVENPKQVLADLAAIARELVLLAVPNLRQLTRLAERTFPPNEINAGHLHSWDHWHLRNLAERHCGLELVAWGSDATMIGGLSNATQKIFGNRAAIALETGFFRRLFPYHCISVIGLFRVATPVQKTRLE